MCEHHATKQKVSQLYIVSPAQDGNDNESTGRGNQTLKNASKVLSYLSR